MEEAKWGEMDFPEERRASIKEEFEKEATGGKLEPKKVGLLHVPITCHMKRGPLRSCTRTGARAPLHSRGAG